MPPQNLGSSSATVPPRAETKNNEQEMKNQ